MTAEEASPAANPPRAALPAKLLSLNGVCRLPVYLACTGLALAITYCLGKDVPWDTFEYHFYAGFSALNDRFGQDYFAAGPQAYLNPYAYVPFYLLTRSGLSSLAVGALLTAWHSAILWLTFELAVVAYPAPDRRERTLIGVWATVLALLNPILLRQLGSSFADITTAELALGGWLLLARAIGKPRIGPVVCGAALLGAATAFKLTNAVHAIGAAAMLMMLPVRARDKIRYAAIYGGAVGLSFSIVAVPWAFRLTQRFGNPFFPLLNDVFQSPEFTTEPVRLMRFIPSSVFEALWRPFAMVDPAPMVHDELRAPDGRFALLALVACALLAQLLWKRHSHSLGQRDVCAPADKRILAALGCGLAVDWTLWLFGSGNSRYFIPMACVAAVLVVGLLPSLLGRRPFRWAAILTVICGIQIFQMWMNPGLRWSSVPWDSGPWVNPEVPEKLKTQPYLYLTMGAQSSSYLAPYVASESGLINFTGAYALGTTGASGARVKALLRRFSPHVRFLAEGTRLHTDLKQLPNVSDVDGALARFGLRADPDDCVTIAVVNSLPAPNRPSYIRSLVSCGAVADSAEYSEQTAGRQTADRVLDRLEDACPLLFQPRRPLSEYRNHRWQRVYLNTDITAWVSRGWVKFYNPVNGDGPIFLGPESDWLKASQRVTCGRQGGHAFARLLPREN